MIMFEVFFTTTGATIAMFTNGVYARQYVDAMLANGHSVDFDVASQHQAEQFVRDNF
jgi:hypothetical protein